jgi:hypothetical protein
MAVHVRNNAGYYADHALDHVQPLISRSHVVEDDLERGIEDNFFVSGKNHCRRIAGIFLIISSIVGFILMGITAKHNGICPEIMSVMLCFGTFGILVLCFLIGVFIAFGLLGLLGGCYCCDLCSQCGQMFACCLMVAEM